MPFLAAIDQGTTSTRCIIFDKQGNVISIGQKEHAQIYSQPGWVEHNPAEIWHNTLEVIALARINAHLHTSEIAAVGITNQRETTVIWNRRTGAPYYNALVWMDTRTEGLVREFSLREEKELIRQKTGLPLATYFSSLKIRWLLDNVPGLRQDAERGEALFGTMDTFLIWNLTGGTKGGLHLTDVTNASRTQLMNLQTLDWDEELLTIFGIPRALLPKICPSSYMYGSVTSEVLPGVALAGVLGDQQAALVGQTCFQPGEAKNTYGTGCFMLLNTGTVPVSSNHGLLTTVAYQFGKEPAHYALEGSIAITGALVQWLRDNLGLIQTSVEVESLARTVEDNGGCYFVPAFSGLYAPYWRPDARGVLAGLTRYVNKGHLARAVLEATAFQTLDVLEAMKKDSGQDLTSLRVDGGMVTNDLLMQFQANMLRVPVVKPLVAETTALGAAYAAGLAVGYFSGLEELKQNWAIDRTYTPAMPEEQRIHLHTQWKKAIERSLDWN